jgi:hypothetical protein
LRTSRKAILLLGLGCPHCLTEIEKKTKVTGLIHNADNYGNTNKKDLLKKQLKGKNVQQGQATQFIRFREPFAYIG